MLQLTQEKETLLIPLYGKAIDCDKPHSILHDTEAKNVVSQLDYDFKQLKIQNKTNTMMCLRAKLIDDLTEDYLKLHPGTTVLHLGCGLDSRCLRIDTHEADWYDVDFEEVISLRQEFFPKKEHYHLVPSSVTERAWIEPLPSAQGNALVLAEGLFMYLKESEIKALLTNLRNQLGPYHLIFDAYSTLTAKNVKNHPSLKRTGAVIHWGIDQPTDMNEWQIGLVYIESQYFTSNAYVKSLDLGTRIMYAIANQFPVALKAHRLLIFEVK